MGARILSSKLGVRIQCLPVRHKRPHRDRHTGRASRLWFCLQTLSRGSGPASAHPGCELWCLRHPGTTMWLGIADSPPPPLGSVAFPEAQVFHGRPAFPRSLFLSPKCAPVKRQLVMQTVKPASPAPREGATCLLGASSEGHSARVPPTPSPPAPGLASWEFLS